MVNQVDVTDEALDFIHMLKEKYRNILFYQSGGCCDGSAVMCYQEGDFLIGENDILLGFIGNVPLYMHKSQCNYWKHTQLIINVTDGEGPAFSLDSLEDKHFITRSRVFTDDEYEEKEKICR